MILRKLARIDIHRIIRTYASSTKMVKVLNVAEKNDAAKSIADVMTRGGFNRRDGFSKFNKIYEYQYNIFNQQCQMVMTSVSGHLLGLEFKGSYRKWYGCSPLSLFEVPVEKYCPDDYKDIKRTLEREVRGAQHLIIWTDCDREGENIGFEIIQVCTAIKPSLKVYRAKFSEITPQAIQRACRSLLNPDKKTSDAVDVRSELDLRIGAAFTRFQTMRLQKRFPNVLAEQLISYGSCQFPTLGFVVERYKQVQAFIPEPFWKLKVCYKKDDKDVDFTWKRNRLFDFMATFVLYQQCIESPLARVVNTNGRSKSKFRPVALDTVELEKLASRKLRINAKETMKIAEKLYTQGFISYPRTETNMFTKEIDLASLVQAQTNDPEWGGFAQRVLERGPAPRNGKKTDNAHPPIHPTKYTNTLQGNEKKLYDYVVRHFLACVSEDAQGFETTVEIDVAEERFTASGLMIIAKNYLEVYPYDRWSAKEIPVFEKEDTFEPTAIELNNGETSPPPLLNEADLIALMDKHGIGTDATHAEHIETIKSRSYVGVRPDGRFVPGQLGMGLVEGYDAMGFEMSKPHLRSELEADLKAICDGRKEKTAVLQTQIQKYREVFVEACRQANKIDEALSVCLGEEAQDVPDNQIEDSIPVMKCSSCGLDMNLKPKKNKNGYFVGCMGFPECKSVIWLPESIQTATVSADTCPRCGPDVHLMAFRFKRGAVPATVPLEYTGCIRCDDVLTTDVGISARVSSGNQSTQSAPRNNNNNSTTANVSSRNYSTSASTQSSTNNRQTSRTGGTTSNRNNQSGQGQGWNNQSGQGQSWNNQSGHSRSYSSNATGQDRTGRVNPVHSSMQRDRGDSDSRLPLASVNTNSGTGSNSGDNEGNNHVVCNCGNDAIQLTVRKEGPNTGRQFYKCGNSTCNFFLWADDAGGDGDNNNSSNNNNNNNNRFSTSSYSSNRGTSDSGQRSWNNNNSNNTVTGSGDAVTCKCGQLAKSLTVQKEGPNKGRPFHSCPAPRGQGCDFFQWGDENSGGGSGFGGGGGGGSGRNMAVGGRGKGRKRQASSEGGAPPKTGKKCGLCGVQGHTKRTCPHK